MEKNVAYSLMPTRELVEEARTLSTRAIRCMEDKTCSAEYLVYIADQCSVIRETLKQREMAMRDAKEAMGMSTTMLYKEACERRGVGQVGVAKRVQELQNILPKIQKRKPLRKTKTTRPSFTETCLPPADCNT
jgi:hypothetical protein